MQEMLLRAVGYTMDFNQRLPSSGHLEEVVDLIDANLGLVA